MRLLPWRKKDAKALVAINKFNQTDSPSGYLQADTLTHATQIIQSYQLIPASRGLVYAIWYHHQIIGYIHVLRLTGPCWEIGYYLSHDKQNCGYMSRAVALLITMVADHTDIQMLQARVFRNNIASMKVLEHNAFQRVHVWDDVYCYQKIIQGKASANL